MSAGIRSGWSCRSVVVLVLLSCCAMSLCAQLPNPNRSVHPSIADIAPGAFLHGSGPMFQYPDGTWNNGEGFAPNDQYDPDYGGWFNLDDGTGLTSADVHTFTWMPGQGFSSPVSLSLRPSVAHPRGAFGVCGILITDLLPQAGEELIVATLSGELIVLTTSLQEIWRTHVDGAIGCYNSIAAEDLDQDGKKELYLAGSRGLWRFVLPGE